MEISELAGMPTGFDQLVGFETILEKVERPGKIISVPTSQINFKALRQDTQLYQHVWKRLYQLGYLSTKQAGRIRGPKRNIRQPNNHTKLKTALKQFQTDANIIHDGWLGLQTWEALQQLYTFDEPTHLADWLIDNRRPALNKSIELRLRVLGIVQDSKKTIRVHMVNRVSGLKTWQIFLRYLGAIPESGGEIEFLTYLYDFDKLTPLLYANYEKILQSDFEFKHDLLQSVLAIELWLHGFDKLAPGLTVNNNPISYAGDNPISKAVTLLCQNENLPVEAEISPQDLIKACLKFFADFEIGQSDTSQLDTEGVVEAIREFSKNEEHAEALSEQIKATSWGAWLFDGIKRAFRWVYRQLKKGVEWLAEKIKSLAIAIKKLSLPVISFYHRTVKILNNGLSVFSHKLFKGSTTEYAIYRDLDFDFKVFIADSANPAQVQHFLDGFNAIWKQVYKTMAIALILLQIIKEAITLASTAAIGLPFVIARFYKFTRSAEYSFIKDAFAAK
ncbi:peptidoglycan-binding domain-containing protein [Paraglaciecola sp. L3A3]|uniref:peptidoglycan-binding domain-containing protein n=1 Tax=Paraglaciecola sp. L3A3 TaxID=2686358 RepID=UPI00131E3AD2|nr:peptidoglycan-binding domain-containing protein [Paraglaciecola sp. L3A3]